MPVAHVQHRPERERRSVGKTTTCANLGIGLAQAGKKVLLIDGDPQGSLTISLGNPQPDKLPFTLSDAMGKILIDHPIRPGEGILHHAEGVDLMPADIQLSGMLGRKFSSQNSFAPPFRQSSLGSLAVRRTFT